MPWPSRICLVRCEQAAEKHLRRRGMRIFLEEVVLDLPDVIDAEPVGEFDLFERILVEPQLGILVPGLRQLMLVKEAEFHPLFYPFCWLSPPLGRHRDGPAKSAVALGHAVHRRIAAATSSGLSSSARWPAPGIATISVRPAIVAAKALGVAARHDPVLGPPDQQCRGVDQRQAAFRAAYCRAAKRRAPQLRRRGSVRSAIRANWRPRARP